MPRWPAPASAVPWLPLRELFDAFADIRGVGFSKMTKALHPKRPALIPMLDSVVQRYLEADDPGAEAPFGERARRARTRLQARLDRNARHCGRFGASSRGAVTSSPRCESSTC